MATGSTRAALPGAGPIVFPAACHQNISRATTFGILTINKSQATTTVDLQNNISAATVNMTSGQLPTGANTPTITSNRTGNGIILGNIQRTLLLQRVQLMLLKALPIPSHFQHHGARDKCNGVGYPRQYQ